MAYTYLYGFTSGWDKTVHGELDPHKIAVAVPKWTRWARTTDTTDEFRLVSGGNLELPTSWSIKRDTVSDIYRNHSYIGSDARVNNRQGVRISFAYKETGKLEGLDPSSDYHILPISLTINATLPIIEAWDDAAKMDFLGRALGAFMGASVDDEALEEYSDFTLRWAGDLRPHHYSGVLS